MDTYCPCCGAKTGRLLCRVNSIPVMVNQLCRTEREARAVLRGDISLMRCEECGTVWNCSYHPEEFRKNCLTTQNMIIPKTWGGNTGRISGE